MGVPSPCNAHWLVGCDVAIEATAALAGVEDLDLWRAEVTRQAPITSPRRALAPGLVPGHHPRKQRSAAPPGRPIS